MSLGQLTKKDRYLLTVKGEETDRPPVWIMRQAGRYMPAYMEMRQRYSFRDFCLKPDVSASAAMLPLEILDVDMLIIFNDILIPLEEIGFQVDFPDGGPRIANPLRTADDLERLKPARFDKVPVVDSIRLLRERAGEDIPILGFCGSPFTMAVYAVEGEISRYQDRIKSLMFREPDLLQSFLEILTDTLAAYLIRQVADGGADGVQIFESWGGVLSAPYDYEEYAAYWQRRLIQIFKAACPDTPVHLFLKGSNGRIESMAATGADVLSIDWMTPLSEARHRTRLTLQGNLDPMVLLVEEAVDREVTRMLNHFDWRRGWIANLGHGIPPQASAHAAKRFVECIHTMAGTH